MSVNIGSNNHGNGLLLVFIILYILFRNFDGNDKDLYDVIYESLDKKEVVQCK